LAVNIESGGRCTSKVRVLNVDDMKGARIAIFSPHLLTVTYESYDNEMNDDLLGPSTLRPANAFICVEVILDGKRVGGRGAYMNVESQWTCKQVLRAYLQKHSPDNCPLPDSTKVIMQCTKQSDTIQGRAAGMQLGIIPGYPGIGISPGIPGILKNTKIYIKFMGFTLFRPFFTLIIDYKHFKIMPLLITQKA